MYKAVVAKLLPSLTGKDGKCLMGQEEDTPSGYQPFRRGSIRDMITSFRPFASGSKDEGCSQDASGHLSTNTNMNQQIMVPMPKPTPAKENVFEDQCHHRNIPSLTLSCSNGSLNDHHLCFCLFEVCLGLREFYIQRGHLPVKDRRKHPDLPISLTGYHDWFLGGYTIWINVTAKQVGSSCAGLFHSTVLQRKIIHNLFRYYRVYKCHFNK